jgi:hypothetical protein
MNIIKIQRECLKKKVRKRKASDLVDVYDSGRLTKNKSLQNSFTPYPLILRNELASRKRSK